jgi:hypothetical protein
MRSIALALAAGTLLVGSAALAAESTGSPGASGSAPGHEMQGSGRMQGSPNAAGFKHDDSTGSTNRTGNSTGPKDAGSGSSPGASGSR